MTGASRTFQVFAKPTGAVCNLACQYCYYLGKELLYPGVTSYRMSDEILEAYIIQHIDAYPGKTIHFHWHGGEPTILGVDYFRRIVQYQQKCLPQGRRVANAIQTNGTLIDEKWCRFLAAEKFTVGLSLDGPRELHDTYRVTPGRKPTHTLAMRGYDLLRQHQIPCDILCVVNAGNVEHPGRVYDFFKQIGAQYVGFLPLVQPDPTTKSRVSESSVPSDAYGTFLCTIFDAWKNSDIGKIIVQNIEEVANTALGKEHALCIFRKTCGDVPVIEHSGDFFSCDHFVDSDHHLGNILDTPFIDLLESPEQNAFGKTKWDSLPQYCLDCEVLSMCHGGCPKDRFIKTPDGQAGLNYLCEGYTRFFNHTRSFAKALTEQARKRSLQQQGPQRNATSRPAAIKTGRNDLCPCGSGRKYKKCCMGK
ncbi:MAG: anaerobic sulfatase maturase [Desulfobacterales bacterium]